MSRGIILNTIALNTATYTALAGAAAIPGDYTLHNPSTSVPVEVSTDDGATSFTLAPGGSIELPGIDIYGMSARALPGEGSIGWTENFERGASGVGATFASGIKSIVANSGAVAAVEPTAALGLGRAGLLSLSTGNSSASGRAALIANSTSNAFVHLGQGEVLLDEDIYVDTLSADAQAFTVALAVTDSLGTAAVGANCIAVTYTHNDTPASGVAGCWTINAYDNSVGSAASVNTNVVVSAQAWYRLLLVANPAGTSATVHVYAGTTGELLGSATIAAHIPTAEGRAVGPMIGIFKSAGNTARLIYTDTQRFRFTPSSPVPSAEAAVLSVCGLFGGVG